MQVSLLQLMNGDRQQPVHCLRRVDQAVSEALKQHLDTVEAAIDETDAMRRCMEGQMIDVIEWKVPFAQRALLQDLLRYQHQRVRALCKVNVDGSWCEHSQTSVCRAVAYPRRGARQRAAAGRGASRATR